MPVLQVLDQFSFTTTQLNYIAYTAGVSVEMNTLSLVTPFVVWSFLHHSSHWKNTVVVVFMFEVKYNTLAVLSKISK